LYDAEIRYNDEYIGAFLDELRERGLLERSLLIVTADHGDAFGEHGYYEHPRYLHDEVTKVPLVVRPPSGRDEVVKTPVSTLDVGATIESAVGGAATGDGVSLLGTLPDDRTVFCQVRGEDEHSHLRQYASRVRSGACFCERNQDLGTIEFGKCTDVTLREELETHINERVRIDNGESVDDEREVNEEIKRRLDALGYK
jgi:arylsulfatase